MPNAAQQMNPAAEAAIRPQLLAAIGKGGPGVLGRLVSQIYHLPQNTIEGIAGLGVPAVKGFGSFVSGDLPGAEKQAAKVAHVVVQSVKQDPFVQAIKHGSLKPLSQDPLGTVMDLTAGFDAAGRVAAGYTRATGKFSRLDENRPVVPGYGAVTYRPLSHNPLLWPIQRAIRGASKSLSLTPEGEAAAKAHAAAKSISMDEARGYVLARNPKLAARGVVPQQVKTARMIQQLRQSEATHHTIGRGQEAHDIRMAVREQKAVRPAAHAGVVPWASLYGASKEGLTQALSLVRQAIHDPAHEDLMPEQQAAMKAHADALHTAITDPKYDPEPIAQAAEAYRLRQEPLQQAKADLGILPLDKATGRMDKTLALAHIPGATFVRKADKLVDPEWKAEHRAAKADVKDARRALDEAVTEHVSTQQAHSATLRTMSDLLRRASGRNEFANDALINHTLALREAVRRNANDVKPITAGAVKDAQKQLREANANLADVKASKRHVHGVLVPDEAAPPLGGKKLGGMQLRRLNPEQDLAHVYGSGIDPAYFRMTNRELPSVRSGPKTANLATQGGENTANRVFTGEALKGKFQPGYGSLIRSQVGDIREISLRRQFQGLLDRTAAPETFGDYNRAGNYAKGVEARTGVPGQIIEVSPGAYKVIPKPSWDEFQAQFERDYPGGHLARTVLAGNRGFRNTVLAFSPKLPVMHTVETTSRTLLNSSYNPLRAIADARIGKLALDKLPEGQRQLLAPGGQAGHGARATLEDMGKVASDAQDRGRLRNAGRAVLQSYDTVTSRIIGAQRFLVKYGEYSSLGKVARQMAQDAGDSWLKANTSIKDLADTAANGLKDPVQAERAAREMHHAFGQYQAYTARTRLGIRIAPFASWYVNAAKFVMLHLPKDHPYLTVLVHDVAKMQQPQWDKQHAGLPPDMAATVNVGPNEWFDLGKLTPLGVDRQPWETALGLIAPQLQGPGKALLGLDPFNMPIADAKKKFHNPYEGGISKDPGGSILRALEQGVEEYAGPANAIARAKYGGGGTLTSASTPVLKMLANLGGLLGNKNHGAIKTQVKTPGSKVQGGPFADILGKALDKAIDPFHPTHYHAGGKNTGSSKGGSGGGGSGGGGSGGGGGPIHFNFQSSKSPAAVREAYVRNFLTREFMQHPFRSVGRASNVTSQLVTRGEFNRIVSELKRQRLIPQNTPVPQLRFPRVGVDGTRSYEMGHGKNARIYISPFAAYGMTDPTVPWRAWAQNTLPHELAHAMQSRQTLSSVPVREGGAQAFSDAVDIPLFGPIPNYDTNYSGYTQAARKRGAQWFMRKQFGK